MTHIHDNTDLQSPDLPNKSMMSQYEAILEIHKERGSFIAETAHFISHEEDMPFYFTAETQPHLSVRPLNREERRNIQNKKEMYAPIHAEKLTHTLEQLNELEILNDIALDLAKGRIFK